MLKQKLKVVISSSLSHLKAITVIFISLGLGVNAVSCLGHYRSGEYSKDLLTGPL